MPNDGEAERRRRYIDATFKDGGLHGRHNHPGLLSRCCDEICREQYLNYREMINTLVGVTV